MAFREWSATPAREQEMRLTGFEKYVLQWRSHPIAIGLFVTAVIVLVGFLLPLAP